MPSARMRSPALLILFNSYTTAGAFGVASLGVEGMRIRSGMHFADRSADALRRLDLLQVRIDEYRHHDSGVAQFRDRLP